MNRRDLRFADRKIGRGRFCYVTNNKYTVNAQQKRVKDAGKDGAAAIYGSFVTNGAKEE